MDDIQRLTLVVFSRVGVVQPLGDLCGNERRYPKREALVEARGGREYLVKIAAVHVLHGEEVITLNLLEGVDLHDVAVVEAHGHAGLVDEHLDEPRVACQGRMDLFDHQQFLGALRATGTGEENLGHSSRSDLADDGVPTEALRHRDRSIVH